MCPRRRGQAFRTGRGMTYDSSMWLMYLAPDAAVPDPAWPSGVVVRTFGELAAGATYVALLNAGSPITWLASWTPARSRHAHFRPDFRPLESPSFRRPIDPMIRSRSCGWSQTARRKATPAPVGEVWLVGVLAEWRAVAWGASSLRASVAQLRALGAGRIKLSVKAENELALACIPDGLRARRRSGRLDPPSSCPGR